MNPEDRREVSERMRKYWAKRKAAERSGLHAVPEGEAGDERPRAMTAGNGVAA